MQYCRIISLDNNNSVKFTSSREDNSTTNDSMVMKIAHAQFHMYTNIMYKFQSNMCKTVGEKLRTKLCEFVSTDGQPWRFQYTPLHFVVGGIIISKQSHLYCFYTKHIFEPIAFTPNTYFSQYGKKKSRGP